MEIYTTGKHLLKLLKKKNIEMHTQLSHVFIDFQWFRLLFMSSPGLALLFIDFAFHAFLPARPEKVKGTRAGEV